MQGGWEAFSTTYGLAAPERSKLVSFGQKASLISLEPRRSKDEMAHVVAQFDSLLRAHYTEGGKVAQAALTLIIRSADELAHLRRDALAPERTNDGVMRQARYYVALERLEAALGSKASHAISLTWERSTLSTKTETVTSIAAERANVMFNIGAQLSVMAAQQDISLRDGQRTAAQLFQRAAGAFTYTRDSICARFARKPLAHSDLWQARLSLLGSVMLAQAQQCCWERIATDTSTSVSVDQIAAATVEYFASANTHASHKAGMFAKTCAPPTWRAHLAAQHAFFLATAHQLVVPSIEKCHLGERIRRLQTAIQILYNVRDKHSSRLASSIHKALKDKMDAIQYDLSEATRVNNKVFYERIVPAAALPPIRRPTDALVSASGLEGVLSAVITDTPAHRLLSATSLQSWTEFNAKAQVEVASLSSKLSELRGQLSVSTTTTSRPFTVALPLPSEFMTASLSSLYVERLTRLRADISSASRVPNTEATSVLAAIDRHLRTESASSAKLTSLRKEANALLCVAVPVDPESEPIANDRMTIMELKHRLDQVESTIGAMNDLSASMPASQEELSSRMESHKSHATCARDVFKSVSAALDGAVALARETAALAESKRTVHVAAAQLSSLANQFASALEGAASWETEARGLEVTALAALESLRNQPQTSLLPPVRNASPMSSPARSPSRGATCSPFTPTALSPVRRTAPSTPLTALDGNMLSPRVLFQPTATPSSTVNELMASHQKIMKDMAESGGLVIPVASYASLSPQRF